MFKRILEAESDVKVSPPREVTVKMKEQSAIFKTFYAEEKKIIHKIPPKINRKMSRSNLERHYIYYKR